MPKTNYKKVFKAAHKRAQTQWEKLGDQADDELICAFNDLDRYFQDGEINKIVKRLQDYDFRINYLKYKIEIVENIKKVYLSNHHADYQP